MPDPVKGIVVEYRLFPMVEITNSELRYRIKIIEGTLRNTEVYAICRRPLSQLLERFQITFDGIETYTIPDFVGKACLIVKDEVDYRFIGFAD
jgi:hypothetical protein